MWNHRIRDSDTREMNVTTYKCCSRFLGFLLNILADKATGEKKKKKTCKIIEKSLKKAQSLQKELLRP